MFGVVTVAVPPHYTSANCSNCREVVKKSLSQRTHRCPHCGHVQDRDWNAAINILELGLRTVGHTGTLNVSGDIDLSDWARKLLNVSRVAERESPESDFGITVLQGREEYLTIPKTEINIFLSKLEPQLRTSKLNLHPLNLLNLVHGFVAELTMGIVVENVSKQFGSFQALDSSQLRDRIRFPSRIAGPVWFRQVYAATADCRFRNARLRQNLADRRRCHQY